MVKTIDYQSRKRAVLDSVIHKYIKNATPVSSEDLAREFDLSPATIRNIFVELEKDGYLTHPYTSGGRIPTNKGYRFYVDFLVSQMELLDEEKSSVIKGYQKEIRRMENLLERTSEVISTITHYTGIVSFLYDQDRFFYKGIRFIMEQPEFHDVTRLRLLIKMIEEKKAFLDIINRDFSDKVKFYIGEELGCAEIQNCSLAVSTFSARKKPVGKLAVLGPVRMEYEHIIPALEYVSLVLTDMLDEI